MAGPRIPRRRKILLQSLSTGQRHRRIFHCKTQEVGMRIKRKEGWQVWVDIHKDHVIKTPKTREEVRYRVKRYLDSIGKSHKIEKTIDRAIQDIIDSINIIKKSKMPMKYFAHPEFLEKGKIKQRRAISIDDKLRELIRKKKISEAKRLIDKFIIFQHKMWEYGIHEKPLKFNLNFGLINNEVVLIDLFELTTNKEKIKKQIIKKPWRKSKKHIMKSLPEWAVDYFIEQADKKITIKNLNKFWKKKIK